jgi:hypothetical protein
MRIQWLIQLVASGATACGALPSPSAMPPQQRFTGQMSGGQAGCEGPATLTQAGNEFVFTPGDGVLAVRGTVAGDGALNGQFNSQPPGKPSYVLTVRGRVGEESADLVYQTPRCRTALTLARAHPGMF